jgi:hypothetical protein
VGSAARERRLPLRKSLGDARRPAQEVEPYCSDIGRTSIEPELMIRMLIVGYAGAAVLNCVSCFKLENASRMYSPNLVSCATALDVKISQNRSKSLFDMF